jgi:ParB-like chromosome segregation protein Spo0J
MSGAESYAIRFSEVDLNDSTCLITYGPPPEKLFRSIQAVGLVQKPLLQRKDDGQLQIICGSRRLAVCRELGLEPLECQVLSTSLPPESSLSLATYDNLAQRILNPVEKSLVLAKMADHMEQAEIIKEFMPLLDLEPSIKLFNRYVGLLQLEPVILDALAGGKLHERTGFALSMLEGEGRLALFQLFEELPFSASVQEELLETIIEIARREGITQAEIISGEDVEKLRAARKRPLRQKAQEIRKVLQARRMPRLTARKEKFSMDVRELGLPSGTRLSPPPYFEGPDWRLEFTFRRCDELAACLRQVAELAEQPSFQRLMERKSGK